MPVSEREVARIIGAIEEGVERPKPTISFEIGEQVRVTDGPFASFNGSVEQVDEERAKQILEMEDLEILVKLSDKPDAPQPPKLEEVFWTCDFSHEYVTINGDYRT